MKTLFISLFLALAIAPSFAQESYGEWQVKGDFAKVGDETVEGTTTGMGILSFDIKADQGLDDLDDRELTHLKANFVRLYLKNKRIELDASAFSFQQDRFRLEDGKIHSVTQFQLFKVEIAHIIPLADGVSITIRAHYGLGHNLGASDDQSLMLSDEEMEIIKTARNCDNCVREGIRDSGGYTYDRGLSVSLNAGNSYFKLYLSEERTGAYHRLLDEPGSQYDYGYRQIYSWEDRKVRPMGVEVGRDFSNGMTLYGRFERRETVSRVITREQGADVSFENSEHEINRDSSEIFEFKFGLKVKLNGFRF